MIDFGGFEPPRLAPGSPDIPADPPYPQSHDPVFVDTSTVLHPSYRLPLLVCAQLGYLNICWSPYVAAEVARVSTREWVVSAIKKLAAEPAGTVIQAALEAMETVRPRIDDALEQLEQAWFTPGPGELRTVMELDCPLQDRKDWPILAGAVATGSRFLLSKDQGSFKHGTGWRNVAFWHPDTFLTAFFHVVPEAYVDVRLDLADIQEPVPLIPAST